MAMGMKRLAPASLLIAALTLAGCQTDYEDMTAAQHAAYSRTGNLYTYKPDPNAPVQVTYRIDEHRFVTLENYDRCYGDNYYNDTQRGIHEKIWTGEPTDYRGRLVIADPSGMNVVLPTARNSLCGDRGCTNLFAYSTDSGRTFRWLDYMKYSFRPSEDSEKFTIAAANDGIYVFQKRVYGGDYTVSKYPLMSGIDLSRPYPAGVHDESFMASKRPDVLPSLHTPSGQDHYTCDASLRAPNLTTPQ
ncbi:hypothetical protein BSU04_21355 [Caballeronia sordidicola]|uniref:Tli3-like domain-containing protein n=2 Tax=Caballeronia sordidicola TaxID=196367 RepID=A0A226WZE2_CABSO|nr:hypothetical protein BSU04_21355 [Caballeronia sordidicola]